MPAPPIPTKCICIPIKLRTFAVLNSSFIYGKSKSHLGIKTHSRVIYLDLGNKTIDVFRDLSVPSGVTIKVQKLKKEQKQVGVK